jgi:uncharacterized protein (UPF0264 family)
MPPKLLVSVTDAAEAALAVAAGADLIDAKDPAAGALGALPPDRIDAIVATVAGRRTVTAVIGDLDDPAAILAAARATAATGVDMVKIGLYPGPDRARLLADLGRQHAGGVRLVGVMLADRDPDPSLVAVAADAGFAGIMMDTAGKAGSLRGLLPPAALAAFVALGHRHGLMVGLAGSLRIADIDALAALGPDLLGFRGGLCEGFDRRRALSAAGVQEAAARLAGTAFRPAAE